MRAFQNLLKDTVHIVKPDGKKIGPYKASVSSSSITIMEKSLDVDEGDHVSRHLPSGKEETYLVISADYSPGLSSIPPHYSLKVRKTTAIVNSASSMRSTTINIHNSTGIQVGDYNTQQIQAIFNELVQKIESSSGSASEKAEAKGRLEAFLEHPLVSSILGSAAGVVLSALAG
jgi:hypothetical protein